MFKSKKNILILTIGLLFLISAVTMGMELGEAPEFKEMVEDGELPPVEERVPENPLVIDVEEIGSYGGTAYTASLAPKGWGDDVMMMDVSSGFAKPKADMAGFVDHLAEEIDISDDKTTYTIHMREGLKWSDGELFTSDDLVYWFEHVLQNEDIYPVIPHRFKAENELVDLEAIDDYTIKFTFSAPKPFFINTIGHWDGLDMMRHPQHYMSQFHPEFVEMEKLEEMAEDAGFSEWYQLYEDKAAGIGQASFNSEKPVIGPYKLTSIDSNRRIWERNPYFWKVDQEGNQLPYIEKIECEILSDVEVLNGQLMSGDLDFGGFYTDIRNYPMFKEEEDKSGIRVILWESGNANSVVYEFNQTHKDPVLRDIFQNVKFRRAMSLAINRQQINEAIFFGRAEPMQHSAFYTSSFYKPEYSEAYVEFDPERANQLLDEIGLDERDNEGFRLRSDGERVSFTVLVVTQETPKKPNAELVVDDWQDVGIDAKMRVVSRNLNETRRDANETDVGLWHGDFSTDILFHNHAAKLVWGTRQYQHMGPLWSSWLYTEGETGEEPPEHVKEIYSWHTERLTEPDDEKRIELAQNILEAQAENLWVIGTVGKTPYPIVVDADLRNVPEDGYWTWDSLWMTTRNPSQWFFAE